jgi:subtilisin family serine protease
LPGGKFVPEGELGRSQVADQRSAIERAQGDLLAELRGTGFRRVREYETIPYVALELSPRALDATRSSPRVTSIAEDKPEPLPRDEGATADQGASTGGEPEPTALASSVPLVQANDMWIAGFTGTGQTIAVLDTGIDSAHPFLTGKVVEEACYSTGNDGSGNAGNCPDGTETQTGPGAGTPCAYTADGCRHGTHVAGIAAGEGSSFSGVARDADVMAVQVFSRFTGADCNGAGEDPCTLTFPSDQIAGLERVLLVAQGGAHDLSSVNMSLGGGKNTSNCDTTQAARKAAIDNLRAADIATAIASGNNGYTDAMSQPACISSAVSVGSTTDSDTVSWFSNIASFLSLLAPGSSIDSSVPGGGFENSSGTSMATPHVAGAWALLKDAHPNASVDDILSALQSTGTSVRDNRTGGTITKPRIDILDASTSLGGGNRPPVANNDPTTAGDPTYTINEGTALTVSAANGVLANDTDPESDPLSAVEVSGPSHGTLMLDGNGSFTYAPAANYNGSDFFAYKAYDGTAYSNAATVSITVKPVPPTLVGVDPINGQPGVPLGSNVTVVFSEKMDEGTLNDNTVRLLKPGKRPTFIPVTMMKSTDGGRTVLTLDPFGSARQKLAASTTYQLTIEGAGDTDGIAVKDLAGNELARDEVTSFTTARK